jgi:hypothetical protein
MTEALYEGAISTIRNVSRGAGVPVESCGTPSRDVLRGVVDRTVTKTFT